jgi:hypothetical protein
VLTISRDDLLLIRLQLYQLNVHSVRVLAESDAVAIIPKTPTIPIRTAIQSIVTEVSPKSRTSNVAMAFATLSTTKKRKILTISPAGSSGTRSDSPVNKKNKVVKEDGVNRTQHQDIVGMPV